MHEPDHLQTPHDRNRPGGEETFSSEEGTRADRDEPVTAPQRSATEKLPDVESGGGQISGPGRNDLTRGLP